MKKSLLALLTLGILSVSLLRPSTANAQFTNNAFYIGPELALAGIGSSGVAFGAFGEVPITHPGSVGSGRLAIALRLDFWTFNDVYYNYTFIPVGVYLDYHFALDDRKFDPFIGLGLGYLILNESYTGPSDGKFSVGYNSGIYVTGQVGARYWFSPNVAGRAELGFGHSFIGAGVDFKLGG